jgi:hypothetical protein
MAPAQHQRILLQSRRRSWRNKIKALQQAVREDAEKQRIVCKEKN